ncbi:MAG TPA: LPS export ABC transporter permease LptF [Steroidobacteraceae bacterium]|nr:LPS export ABC transporter permease LptF [Steroidobacteraceae bacterium]
MRILQRYLLREMTLDFLGVTVVAAAVMLVNTIGEVLARAAELQYQKTFVMELIGLSAAQNVALLLPVGLLLGLVLAFGRLYHDSEMAAAQASGVGMGRVSAAVWLLAVPVAVLGVWLNFYLGPRAAMAEENLRAKALRAGILAPLESGRFRTFDGRVVVYARTTAPDGDLNDVFVERTEGPIIDTTVARRAHYAITAQGETITLFDGERVEGTPGTNHYRIMRFQRQLIPFNAPNTGGPRSRVDEMSTAQLFGSRDRRLQAELQWRVGLPVMTLIFGALAVPLGRLRPRQGRYAHVWLAILAFAFYAVLAQAGRSWIEHGDTPMALGLWWVHAIFLCLSVGALLQPRVARAWRARRARGTR